MTASVIRVGERLIAPNEPTFVIAEIGANHNGDVGLARELVHAAADTGVDAVKFQLYTTEELLADRNRIITWGRPGSLRRERIGDMFNRISLPRDAIVELFDYAEELGVIAFATPFSVEAVRFLDALGMPLFKIASSDVSYIDLLRIVARTGKPLLLSTGKSTLGELDRAVREVLAIQDNPGLAVLHCVATYPAPFHEMNLRFIPTLSSLYPEAVVGFSDHSLGITAAIAAVTLGARVVEKHFTMDKSMDGPDHWFSADVAELTSLVREVRHVEAALGSSGKRLTDSEGGERTTSTRSLVVRLPVTAGTALRAEHLKVVRPGSGIHPHDIEKVLGLRVVEDLAPDTVLRWSHFRGEDAL